jgi:hypothetical protein
LRRYKEVFSDRIVAESILSSEIANHLTEVSDYFLISGTQVYDEVAVTLNRHRVESIDKNSYGI